MNWPLFERACGFGLVALIVALGAQWALQGRVPASWRVWLWRVALLQTALALVPWAPLQLAVLPPPPVAVRAAISSPALLPPQPNLATRHDISPLPRPKCPSPAAPSLSDSHAAPDATAVALNSAAEARLEPAKTPKSLIETAQTTAPRFASSANLWLLLSGVYAMGWAAQIAALGRCFLRVRQVLHFCQPLEDRAIEAPLQRAARHLEARPLPRLLQRAAGAPFLVGVVAPSIVLPQALLAAPTRDLEAVLHHELAHLRRRDLVWNLVLWPIQTVFWFHPLVWASRRFLALEVESACDEMVLSSTRITPKSYGALLLNTMNPEPNLLTAGVSDGFGAFKTRLHRLNQLPKRPHRAARVVFVAALLLSSTAIVPLRLVTRAAALETPAALETAAETATLSASKAAQSGAMAVSNSLRGVVRDRSGQPVAGATVYAMLGAQNEPLEISKSDKLGHFEFSSKVRVETDGFGDEFSVFADAGQRGMGDASAINEAGEAGRPVEIRVTPAVRAVLRFLDPQGRPAPGLKVRFSGIVAAPEFLNKPLKLSNSASNSTSARALTDLSSALGRAKTNRSVQKRLDELSVLSLAKRIRRWKRRWIAIPRQLSSRLQATTNAKGEAIFPALPRGVDARFWAGDKKPLSAWNGPISYRGALFAPLRLSSSLDLLRPQVQRTLRLVAATGIAGRVLRPDGSGAFRARVSAWQIQGPNGVYHLSQTQGSGQPQAVTDGAGNYQLEGLRPGRYLIQVFPHPDELNQFVGPISEMIIGSTHRADFRLSRGILVEGTLVGQGTKTPVKGQILDLHNISSPHRRYYYDLATDARGQFRFRVGAGPQRLRLKSKATGYLNMPPSGFALPAKKEFDFSLADGQRRRFLIEMPLAPRLKAPARR